MISINDLLQSVTEKISDGLYIVDPILTDSRTLKEELESLRSLAFVDELTGVLNRRGFEYFLNYKKMESERFKRIFGVLFIDIDAFKLIE